MNVFVPIPESISVAHLRKVCAGRESNPPLSRRPFADDDSWRRVARTESGPLADFVVSYTSLLPSTEYRLRLLAYNRHGVSFPAEARQPVATPSKLYMQ